MCVLAPRSMGANKFGLAASFMQNGELMVTDKKEGMRQEKEGRSQSHKRGVWGSIHPSLGHLMSEDRISADAFGPNCQLLKLSQCKFRRNNWSGMF